MEHNTHNDREFSTLCRSIAALQLRQFILVGGGLAVLPLACYGRLEATSRAWIIMPCLALVAMLLYLMQQKQIERFEEAFDDARGTLPREGARPRGRRGTAALGDPTVCLVLLFFAAYVASVAVALYGRWVAAAGDPSGSYWNYLFAAAGVYTVTTCWASAAVVGGLRERAACPRGAYLSGCSASVGQSSVRKHPNGRPAPLATLGSTAASHA
ncbi:MAG TPA: hypothetical protein P5572_13985 [Phycisphaerae bacterium]|nr:hypothetical protein [Phycisphaerae bacterium]